MEKRYRNANEKDAFEQRCFDLNTKLWHEFRSLGDAMSPDKLLRNGTLGDISKVFEEGSALEVNIKAITEAVMLFSNKSILVNTEGE